MKTIRFVCVAIVATFGFATANAAIIPYAIDLIPTSGPGGSGSFDWDDSTGDVANFILTLDPFGPFAGGAQDGAPASLGSVFNGSSFTTQVELLYSPYFDLFLNADGSYNDFNGRADGTYVTKTAAVPEPTTIALMALGLLGLGLVTRRRPVRALLPS